MEKERAPGRAESPPLFLKYAAAPPDGFAGAPVVPTPAALSGSGRPRQLSAPGADIKEHLASAFFHNASGRSLDKRLVAFGGKVQLFRFVGQQPPVHPGFLRFLLSQRVTPAPGRFHGRLQVPLCAFLRRGHQMPEPAHDVRSGFLIQVHARLRKVGKIAFGGVAASLHRNEQTVIPSLPLNFSRANHSVQRRDLD